MEAADRELVAAGVKGADVGAGNDNISLKRPSVKNSNGGGKGGAGGCHGYDREDSNSCGCLRGTKRSRCLKSF